jgi:hypothetical protein
MTTTKKLTPLVAVALGSVLLLAGCTGTNTNADPTSTPKSSTPTPKPTPTPTAPATVAPPTSNDEAYAQANATIRLFIQKQYQIEAARGKNVDIINTVATGDALTSMQKIASDLGSAGLSITGGAPGWQDNPSVSTFGTVTGSDGKKIANGIVYMKGCWDLSKQKTVAQNGTPPADRTVKVFPIQFNVAYLPDTKTWKVTSQDNITGQSGAPKC